MSIVVQRIVCSGGEIHSDALGSFRAALREGEGYVHHYQVFDKNSVYLPTKKIGKNNPKAAEIEPDNTARQNPAKL